MKTILDPKIQNDPRLSTAIKQATTRLEEEIGSPADRVTADWSVATDDRKRPILVLALSDYLGEAKGVFTPEELQHSERLPTRFNHLWADVLEIGSKKQMERLKQMVQELEGE